MKRGHAKKLATTPDSALIAGAAFFTAKLIFRDEVGHDEFFVGFINTA